MKGGGAQCCHLADDGAIVETRRYLYHTFSPTKFLCHKRGKKFFKNVNISLSGNEHNHRSKRMLWYKIGEFPGWAF